MRSLSGRHRLCLLRLAITGLAVAQGGCRFLEKTQRKDGPEECPKVWLAAPGPRLTVWEDGTVAMAAALAAPDEAQATGVVVESISLVGGTVLAPASFPVALGSFSQGSTLTVRARFQVPADGTSRELRIAGRFDGGKQLCPFEATVGVNPVAESGPRSLPARPMTAPVKTPGTSTWGPAPPRQERTGPEVNPQSPPIPEGPPRNFMTVPSKASGRAKLPVLAPDAPPFTPPEQGGPSAAVFTRNNLRGGLSLSPPDPSVAASTRSDVVMISQNFNVAWSNNGGASFTDIDPNAVTDPANPARTTMFPPVDNGMGCDQVLTWSPRHDLFIWVIQTWPNTIQLSGKNARGSNRLRIAWARPAALTSNFINAWSWIDIDSGLLGIGNDWVDYPDVTVSDNFVYVSVDRARDVILPDGTVGGTLVGTRFYTRWSLNDMNAGAGSVGGAFVEINHAGIVKGHIARGSPDTMYFAGLFQTSTLRMYTWPDSTNTVTWSDIPITSFKNDNYVSLAPDGANWNVGPIGILAATLTIPNTFCFGGDSPGCKSGPHRFAWFGFGAGRDAPGRPHPYVRLVSVDIEAAQRKEEVDIWNAAFAFSTPSLASVCGGAACELAISLGTGGGGGYAEHAAGFLFDWLVYTTSASDGTQSRFGDYFNVIPSLGPPTPTGRAAGFFSTLGYGVRAVTAGQTCAVGGCTFEPHYVQFGRAGSLNPPLPPH